MKFRVTWDPPATCRWTRPEMDRASCGCTQVHGGPSWTLAVLWRWHHPSLCREQQLMRWYSVTNFFHLLVVFIPGRSATRRHWQLTTLAIQVVPLARWHVRSRARQLMRLYSLPSLTGLSPWRCTGADSESAWPEALAMDGTVHEATRTVADLACRECQCQWRAELYHWQ